MKKFRSQIAVLSFILTLFAVSVRFGQAAIPAQPNPRAASNRQGLRKAGSAQSHDENASVGPQADFPDIRGIYACTVSGTISNCTFGQGGGSFGPTPTTLDIYS